MKICLTVFALSAIAGCSSLSSLAGPDEQLSADRMFQPVHAVSTKPGASGTIGYAAPSSSATAVYQPGEEQAGGLSDTEADPGLARQRVTLAFVDTDVREFSRVMFSELLRRPYTVDQGLQGTITVRSSGEVDGVTALAMARQALEATGNTVILNQGVYRITSIANRQLDASSGVKTFKLKHIDGAAAREAIGPFLANRAEIVNVSGASLSIRGDAEIIALAGSLIETIDIDRFKQSSFGLFPLQNGKAADVAEELQALYAGAGVSGQTLLPIERLNAVLVVTRRADQLEFARTWIARLDHGRSDQRQISVYQVKNREAADLAKLLQDIFASAHVPIATGSADANGALAVSAAVFGTEDEGSLKITADAGSNSLVIWALPRELDVVHQALRRLDTPLEQVYVEATIAEVRLNGELSHGVRWFLQSGAFSGGVTDASDGTIGPEYPGFNFSFKVPQAHIVISALESYTDVKIVSSPQLTVIDHQTATIQVGDQVPIVTKSVQDTSSGANVIANDVTFRDTGVILKVTPDIRSSGEVLLNIEQEVSRVLPTTSSQINSPTISQRKVQSTVLVPDGDAIILGGLMSANDETANGGLPGTQKNILQSIFGSKTVKSSRSELIIIIRPVIIRNKDDLRAVVAEIADKLGSLDLR